MGYSRYIFVSDIIFVHFLLCDHNIRAGKLLSWGIAKKIDLFGDLIFIKGNHFSQSW